MGHGDDLFSGPDTVPHSQHLRQINQFYKERKKLKDVSGGSGIQGSNASHCICEDCSRDKSPWMSTGSSKPSKLADFLDFLVPSVTSSSTLPKELTNLLQSRSWQLRDTWASLPSLRKIM